MSTPTGLAPPHALGVCSWSLQPSTPADLVAKLRAAGLARVQLALDPVRTAGGGEWSEIAAINTLHAAGITIESGMMGMAGEDYSTLESIARTGGVRSDANWPANLAAAAANARLASRLGIGLVTFHAGFIPHNAADPVRAVMLARLRQVIDLFDDRGVRVGFETGQESADTLLDALAELDRPHAGVNFDPANMILYGTGDPIEALGVLQKHVISVHAKDGDWPPQGVAGALGTERPLGQGAVGMERFIAKLKEIGYQGTLNIEREGQSPEQWRNDVQMGAELLRRLIG